MTIVNFNHNSNGQMTTTAENWIKYYLFDATNDEGESYPVLKEDCQLINTEEV